MQYKFIVLGVLDWVIRVSALFIVFRNRKYSSATAWIVIFLLPFVGLSKFLILGNPILNKQRGATQRSINKVFENLANSTASVQ